jgi:hypothetical protein
MQAMSEKVDDITRWLAREAPDIEKSQKHLDEGTIERAYWHYGYLCGARDFLALVRPLPE